MLILYSLALFLLGATGFLVRRRVASLEKKYQRVAREADGLLRPASVRPGNGNRFDPFQVAKQQYLLGQLIQKRDRVEARYTAWQSLADRFHKVLARGRGWKGRLVPYAFGAIDVYVALSVIDYLGFAEKVHYRQLAETVATLLK